MMKGSVYFMLQKAKRQILQRSFCNSPPASQNPEEGGNFLVFSAIVSAVAAAGSAIFAWRSNNLAKESADTANYSVNSTAQFARALVVRTLNDRERQLRTWMKKLDPTPDVESVQKLNRTLLSDGCTPKELGAH